jgi:RNAse (barnase) inhibitor barstar
MLIIKVYLLLLFIDSLYRVLSKQKITSLSCGLTAYCGDKPANLDWIKLLMIYNTTRGVHATGISINDAVVKDTKAAFDFIAESATTFIYDQNKQFTILGHDRSASSGPRESKELAHPFIFKRTKAKGSIFGMHNGTITNISDLCDKYGIDHSYQNSDSYHLFKIMSEQTVEETINPLKEIAGSATIIFYNQLQPNKIYVHRDTSRELFYWKASETQMYISSIKASLRALGAPEASVVEFKEDILFEITNGNITNEKPVPKTVYKKTYTHSNTYVHKGGAVGKDDFFRGQTKSSVYRNTGTNSLTKDLLKTPSVVQYKDDVVRWHKHRYYINSELADGILVMNDQNGRTIQNTTFETNRSYWANVGYSLHYFVLGSLCKGKSAYEELRKLLFDIKGKDRTTAYMSMYGTDKSKYSMYPVSSNVMPVVYLEKEIDEDFSFSPILSNFTFNCDKTGTILSTVANEKSSKKSTDENSVEFIIENSLVDFKVPDLYKKYLSKNVLVDSIMNLQTFCEHFLMFCEKQCIITSVDCTRLQKENAFHQIMKNELPFMLDIYRALEKLDNAWNAEEPLLTAQSEINFHEADDDDNEVDTLMDYAVSHNARRITTVPVNKKDQVSAINTIVEDLRLAKNASFRQDILYGDIDCSELLINYVTSDTPDELYDFYVSVLAVLQQADFFSPKDFLEVINEPNTKIYSDAKEYLELFNEEKFKKKADKTSVAPATLKEGILHYYHEVTKLGDLMNKTSDQKNQLTNKTKALLDLIDKVDDNLKERLKNEHSINVEEIKNAYGNANAKAAGTGL